MTSYEKFNKFIDEGCTKEDFWSEAMQWLPSDTIEDFTDHCARAWDVDIEMLGDVSTAKLWDELTHYLPEDQLNEFADDFEALYL